MKQFVPEVTIDWTKTNGQLAKEAGCTVPTIRAMRIRKGIKPLRRGRPSKVKVEPVPVVAPAVTTPEPTPTA